ncbi:hypothetical protein AURDEDRAFT_159216 [Auricularia subglabra TFB-10046 SS5]|nr:hypothetical protein AURDEDRAFT_159216 [Auricularia subglabra TFB-10046 SS5]
MPQGFDDILDEDLLATLIVMYTLPDALRIAANLTAVLPATLVQFEALESTAGIGEAWSLAVSAEEDAKRSLETAQSDLEAAGNIVSPRARESAQSRATKKVESVQRELEAASNDRGQLEDELKQGFVDWYARVQKEEDAKREAHNAELKKKNAADLAEAKKKTKKDKKASESEVSEGRNKVKDGDPVDGVYRDTPCALCEHGGFACYDKAETKGRACAACTASKQPCFIPLTGSLKGVLKGITERLDAADGRLEVLEEKYEDFASGVNAIKGVLKDQGECLGSLAILMAENQEVLDNVAEKLEVGSSKSAGKRRHKKRKASKAVVSSDVVEVEDDDAGPSRKRRKVGKAKSGPQVVESEVEDEGAAEKEKQGKEGKEKEKDKEKEKSPEGPEGETLQSD